MILIGQVWASTNDSFSGRILEFTGSFYNQNYDERSLSVGTTYYPWVSTLFPEKYGNNSGFLRLGLNLEGFIQKNHLMGEGGLSLQYGPGWYGKLNVLERQILVNGQIHGATAGEIEFGIEYSVLAFMGFAAPEYYWGQVLSAAWGEEKDNDTNQSSTYWKINFHLLNYLDYHSNREASRAETERRYNNPREAFREAYGVDLPISRSEIIFNGISVESESYSQAQMIENKIIGLRYKDYTRELQSGSKDLVAYNIVSRESFVKEGRNIDKITIGESYNYVDKYGQPNPSSSPQRMQYEYFDVSSCKDFPLSRSGEGKR
jgi:hypothetical protein